MNVLKCGEIYWNFAQRVYFTQFGIDKMKTYLSRKQREEKNASSRHKDSIQLSNHFREILTLKVRALSYSRHHRLMLHAPLNYRCANEANYLLLPLSINYWYTIITRFRSHMQAYKSINQRDQNSILASSGASTFSRWICFPVWIIQLETVPVPVEAD